MTDIQSNKAHLPARDSAGNRLAAKRAAKAAQKAASRGTASPADDVVKGVSEVNAWLDTHGRKLWLGAAGVVVVIVGGILVSRMMEHGNRDAGGLLHTAVTTSHGIIVAPEETAPEDANNLFPTFSSEKERDEKALAQFRDVVKKDANAKSAPGAYGALGEANELLKLGKPAEASAVFEKLRAETVSSDNTAEDSFLAFRTLEGAGYALEGQKKFADARARFEQLSQLNKGAYRTVGDYHRARMLVAEGKRDEAKKLLEAMNKAAADKPADAAEPGDRFESVSGAAQTLLSELGGQPAERSPGGNSGISQQVLDSLRKQLGNQKK